MVWLWPSISMIEMTSLFPFRAFMIEFSEVVLGRMLPSPQITVILIKSSSPLYQLLFSLEYWLFELPAPRSDSVTRSLVPALDFEHLCLWGSHGIIFRSTHLLRTFSFLFVCSVVCMCVCLCAQPLSRVWLLATPWTVAHQAPLPMGLSQQEYWSGLTFLPPGDLSDQGIKPASPVSSALVGGFFTSEPHGNPHMQ